MGRETAKVLIKVANEHVKFLEHFPIWFQPLDAILGSMATRNIVSISNHVICHGEWIDRPSVASNQSPQYCR